MADVRKTVSGFLIMQCCACNRIKIFTPRKPLTKYECVCGQRNRIDDVIPAYVHCECGARHKYLTNSADPMLTAECIRCGSPVELELNSRMNVYKTIGSEYRGKQKRRR